MAFAGVFEWIQQLSETSAGQRLLSPAGDDTNTDHDEDSSAATGGGPSGRS